MTLCKRLIARLTSKGINQRNWFEGWCSRRSRWGSISICLWRHWEMLFIDAVASLMEEIALLKSYDKRHEKFLFPLLQEVASEAFLMLPNFWLQELIRLHWIRSITTTTIDLRIGPGIWQSMCGGLHTGTQNPWTRLGGNGEAGRERSEGKWSLGCRKSKILVPGRSFLYR